MTIRKRAAGRWESEPWSETWTARSARWATILGLLLSESCTLATSVEEGDAGAVKSESHGDEAGANANDGGEKGYLTVLMIVDRSGSMAESWEGSPKWQIARDAVSHAVIGVEDQLSAGALLFPVPESCSVEPLDSSSQIDFVGGHEFKRLWDQNTLISMPNGSTPLGEAMRQADRAIARAREAGYLEGRFRVVLVSDGQPTCFASEEEMVKLANTWREMGIDVRVMGLPGSAAAAALLNRIAGEEVYEDAMTGEVIVPDSDSNWSDEGNTNYIEPEDSQDVDDSFYDAVR